MALKIALCAIRSNLAVEAPNTVAGQLCAVLEIDQATDQWLIEAAKDKDALVAIALDRLALTRLRQAQAVVPRMLTVLTASHAATVIDLLRDGLTAAEIAYPALFSPGRLLTEAAGELWQLELEQFATAKTGPWIRLEPDRIVVDRNQLQPLEVEALETRQGLPLDGRKRLLIGPTNRAGLANAWTQAVQNHLPGWSAQNLSIRFPDSTGRIFLSDVSVDKLAWDLPVTRADIALDLLAPVSHVLMEDMRPFLGQAGRGGVVTPELAAAEARMIIDSSRKFAVVLHGGIEDPQLITNQQALAGIGRPEVVVFVSRPELVEVVEQAVWLPMALTAGDLAPAPQFGPETRLKVAYAPPVQGADRSNGLGLGLIKLAEAGVIDYLELDGFAPVGIPGLLRGVDVVVDQLSQPGLSLLALQGLAAGRLVVCDLPPAVATKYPTVPPVLNTGKDQLTDLLLDLARDPARYQAIADAGPEYAHRFHDGRAAVKVLNEYFLAGAN